MKTNRRFRAITPAILGGAQQLNHAPAFAVRGFSLLDKHP